MPPNCSCPAGHDWDAGASACKERPKCTGGKVGMPPNCKCPGNKVSAGENCVECTGGTIKKGDKCVCEAGERFDEARGQCVVCPGNRFTKSTSNALAGHGARLRRLVPAGRKRPRQE
jgi:hypothetical protein